MKNEIADFEFPRKQVPRIISSHCVAENGRIVTKFQVDASRELGRGRCYWLSSYNPRPAAEAQKQS
jgi:hypothetical protein